MTNLIGRWLAVAVFLPTLCLATQAESSPNQQGSFVTLENAFLKRSISTVGEVHTTSITNKLDGKILTPISGHAFVIHLRDGRQLSSADFRITDFRKTRHGETDRLSIQLSCSKLLLKAELIYTLNDRDFFLRKQLTLTPEKPLSIERIDLESMQLDEAYQPYTISQITAQGPAQWRPGLGQPLYTKTTGTFWGVEFPAAENTVRDGVLTCSYSAARTIPTGATFTTHTSVMGVSDSPEFIKDAFFEYIDRTRVRPLRLQTQYNSWFDYGGNVNAAKFASSVALVHRQLHKQRGVPPLRAYVIDDGWQNTSADWSQQVWQVNGKFDANFSRSRQATDAADSSLGLWLSPGCLFGGQAAIPKMRAAGFRSLDPWMSLTDPGYMDKLEERMTGLARDGVSYFKLDGVFGHLNTRNFDVPGFKGSEAALNAPQYDPQKIQYLAAGSERLIQMFAAMHDANPDVYIVISNGAWLSPWWLQHIDSVWMINAGDAAGGSTRTQELVYRDGVYHDLAVTENTQFPLHSLFNHEPKKTSSKETKETFRQYLYMNMSRGTGFVELYIKPSVLQDYDWDVLAEGLHWAHAVFPTFKRARMHGGNPKAGEPYGYTGWLPTQGYISLHNPSDETQTYTLTLDRSFGLHPDAKNTTYLLSSPVASWLDGLNEQYRYGDSLRFTLKPREIRVLNFDVTERDWKTLVALQTRTADDFTPPQPIPIADHAILGIWKYGPHTREFKADGTCTLRSSGVEQWTKNFVANSPTQVTIEGTYGHKIQKDGSLNIEGRYTATKVK
ncbi:hypothetical protein [Novipirellula rosea]|uniref:Alpha-galactosidase n=1 Tax=Novipirellula rosea TaxID=1031540 RepID=A0ABP8NA45_9BACT